MVQFRNPFSRQRRVTSQIELKELEIQSLKDTISILAQQRNDIVDGQKVVVSSFQKALDLDDHVIDRYDLAHKDGLIEQKPLPLSIPKGADISDLVESLISESDISVPFLGSKGKGMIISMIRKNRDLINSRGEEVMGSLLQNITKEQFAEIKSEYSSKIKEDGK